MPATPSLPGIPTPFIVFGAVIALLAVIIFALAIRNAIKVRRAGHDPFTLQADLATRLMDSELLSAERSVRDRLAELDGLRRQNVITEREYTEARTSVLRAG